MAVISELWIFFFKIFLPFGCPFPKWQMHYFGGGKIIYTLVGSAGKEDWSSYWSQGGKGRKLSWKWKPEWSSGCRVVACWPLTPATTWLAGAEAHRSRPRQRMVPHVTGPERSKFKIQSRVSTEYVTFTPSESHAALQQKLTRRLKPAVFRQKGFPADSAAENPPASAGDGGLILESGSLPGGGHGNPL